MSKEPGELPFNLRYEISMVTQFHPDAIAAIRADERAKVIEECAKIAEDAKRAAPLCPYGRDKPGDPTWNHTDDDICPVCRKNGHDSLHTCTDALSGNIAAALRSKIGESPP